MHAESLKNDRNVGSNTMLERPAFPRVNVRILEATVLGWTCFIFIFFPAYDTICISHISYTSYTRAGAPWLWRWHRAPALADHGIWRAVSVGLAHWKRWRIRGSGGWHGQAGGGGVLLRGYQWRWEPPKLRQLGERFHGFRKKSPKVHGDWVDFEEI